MMNKRLRPKPHQRDVVLDEPPEMQICMYDTGTTILTRRLPHGGYTSYPVELAAVARSLANIPSGSGLLPEHTLATGYVNGQRAYLGWKPAQIGPLQLESGTLTVALPPLLWLGVGREYRVFAVNQDGYPQADWELYHAPLPNVFAHGGICWGDSDPRPDATPRDFWQAFDLFLTHSRFNEHLAGGKSRAAQGNVLLQLQRVAESGDPYPYADLVPMHPSMTLARLVENLHV